MNDSENRTPQDSPRALPVAELLTLGEDEARLGSWPDYVTRLGLAADHVPELIRIATDAGWYDREEATGPEIWAPIHARRALGQLGAVQAARPLAELLARAEDDDWALEELPLVLGMLGRPALPSVRAVLRNPRASVWARAGAAEGLRYIAEAEPAARDEAVAAITEVLGLFASNDPEFNAFLIGALIELCATEAAPLIQQAFEADAVEESIFGDWEEVQIGLGLLEQRITPRPRYHLELSPFIGASREWEAPTHTAGAGKRRQKAARKRKLERKSRRKNRKKR